MTLGKCTERAAEAPASHHLQLTTADVTVMRQDTTISVPTACTPPDAGLAARSGAQLLHSTSDRTLLLTADRSTTLATTTHVALPAPSCAVIPRCWTT